MNDQLQNIEADSLQRAIELANFLHDELSSSSFTDHKSISNASGGTTVGISFDERNSSVTACMVGGPAFNSKQVHPNDVIVAIDGQEVKGPEILDLLIGNDKPGSVVELTLKRASVGSFALLFLFYDANWCIKVYRKHYLFPSHVPCHHENHDMV